MKIYKKALLLIVFAISGCFLVISHDEKFASVLAVHLLPPKVEQLVVDKNIDAHFGVFPFDFNLSFSEEKEPLYFDYSLLPIEFSKHLTVFLHNNFFKTVIENDRITVENDISARLKIMQEKKLDSAIFGKVEKIRVGKRSDGWYGYLVLEYTIISSDGVVNKTQKFETSYEKLEISHEITIEYQAAIAATNLFNKAYNDIFKSVQPLLADLEMHRSAKEIIKGKGIITVRKGGRFRGKVRLLMDMRIKIIISDYERTMFGSMEKLDEDIKKLVTQIKRNDHYKLMIGVKDSSEIIYPFRYGKIGYDSNIDYYALTYSVTKEFYVGTGKNLVVASFFLPNTNEVVTKGFYVDVNPEKGANVGFSMICETKKGFVDMSFVK